jgi:hypothetical protein
MGMLICLMMTAFVVYGLFWFVVSHEARMRFFQELWALFRSPRTFLFVLWSFSGAGCCLAFFWGLLIPPLGRIKIGGLELWQLAGVGALAWAVMNFAYLLVDDYLRTRRLRKRSVIGRASWPASGSRPPINK